MENVLTITNVKQNIIEFTAGVEGIDDNDMRVQLVIEANGMNFSFDAKRLQGTDWEVIIPPLPVLEKTTYSFHMDVVSEGYFFKPISGILNVVGTHEIFATDPKNKTIGSKEVESLPQKHKAVPVDAVEEEEVENRISPKKIGGEPPKMDAPKETNIADLAARMVEKSKVKKASDDELTALDDLAARITAGKIGKTREEPASNVIEPDGTEEFSFEGDEEVELDTTMPGELPGESDRKPIKKINIGKAVLDINKDEDREEDAVVAGAANKKIEDIFNKLKTEKQDADFKKPHKKKKESTKDLVPIEVGDPVVAENTEIEDGLAEAIEHISKPIKKSTRKAKKQSKKKEAVAIKKINEDNEFVAKPEEEIELENKKADDVKKILSEATDVQDTKKVITHPIKKEKIIIH